MMKKILFVLFFVSGFCALLYQTVWLRLAFASFGINAQVISVVLSVFMLGLVLGSFVSGRYLIKLANEYKIKSLYFYALAEAGVGLGALLVPKLFWAGRVWLLTFGEANSALYLSLSAIVLFLAMLPWCFFMGTTIPLIIDYLNNNFTKDKNIFSFLYLANTLGAMAGVALTAGILIEAFGFEKTLLFASMLNFSIAIVSFGIAWRFKKPNEYVPEKEKIKSSFILTRQDRFMLALLFFTGFSSMGFEIIWNRLFTPILETSVYAFAFVLFIYLLGTCLGLFHYRRNLRSDNIFSIRFLLLALSIFSVIQIWFVDPRINLGIWGIIFSVGFISYLLGYLTPRQIDELSEGNPSIVGLAYAVNLLGCILGPLFASYILMPLFGSKFSIILLSVPLLAFLFLRGENIFSYQFNQRKIFLAMSILILITAAAGTTYEEWLNVSNKIIKNDYNATVLAATINGNDPRSKYLMVNGVGMTMLTPITKIMAHLPLFALPKDAKRALVICLGMGTTFRSVASWGMQTTAVELTPSVAKLFPYFFNDAAKILENKNNKIVIDDGRRFLERTSVKYDLVTID
ncbi:MAG: hypothetical protein WAN61_02140, partial [Minisyncoccia bacterium]